MNIRPLSSDTGAEEATAGLESAHQVEIDRLAQQHAEALGRAEGAEARAQEATARAEAAREEVHLAQETLESAKSKAKADMKVIPRDRVLSKECILQGAVWQMDGLLLVTRRGSEYG